jgi:hypothetical protein
MDGPPIRSPYNCPECNKLLERAARFKRLLREVLLSHHAAHTGHWIKCERTVCKGLRHILES